MEMQEESVILDAWEKARSPSVAMDFEDGNAVGISSRPFEYKEYVPELDSGVNNDIDDAEESEEEPRTPGSEPQVIIYNPSQNWVSLSSDAVSQPPISPMQDPMPLDTADENASVWSMTHYGPLDWDHSGDEFDKIEAKPKITRRSSSASPRDAAKVQAAFMRAVTPLKRKAEPSTLSVRRSCSLPRERDAHGRFAPKSSSPVTPKKRKRSVSSAPTSRNKQSSPVVNQTSHLVPETESPVACPQRVNFKVAKSSPTEKKSLRSSGKESAAQPSVSITPPKRTSPRLGPPEDDKNLSIAKRDAKGRFAPKNKSPTALSKGKELLTGIGLDGNEIAEAKQTIEVIIPAKAKTKTKRVLAKSPYFTPPVTPSNTRKGKVVKGAEAGPSNEKTSRSSAKTVSCVPFPPLSSPYFGLIQEKLANDPFRLLIAVTFLIQTHGKHAIPVFYTLMEKYPTPESLATAEKQDIVDVIQRLGLQNVRAEKYQRYAKIWLEDPPVKDKRYRVLGYPLPGDGRDIKKDEVVVHSDERSAWEIGHMTSGPYALDSWRIFCRDVLRGVAEGWNAEGAAEGFQPEWMRVLPEDKELRAYLRWMWLKEGFDWDPLTGEKEIASQKLLRAAMEGRIVWDDKGGMMINAKKIEMVPGLSQVGNVHMEND